MKLGNGQKFSDKHGPDARPDEKIREKIILRAKEGHLPCAVAFKIAAELAVSPAEVGKTVDLMEWRLSKCQLGLFGYQPEKKIVKPATPENPAITDAIRQRLVDGKISCKDVWEIADKFGVPKMSVSAAGEALNIKIKTCQLGAF